MRPPLFALLSVVLLTSACAPGQPAPRADIVLERTACFGTCPVYTVHVSPSGLVEWDGRRFVRQVGTATAQLDSAALQELADRVAEARLEDLRDSYEDNCPENWTDNPSVHLRVSVDSLTRSITDNHGCRGLPELKRLRRLEDEIDRIVNTKQWID